MNLEIRKDMPEEDYHKLKAALSNSTLGKIRKCPANINVEKEVKAMVTGSGLHDIILYGEDYYLNKYVVSPTSDRRKKEYKEFVANAPEGKTILTPDEEENIRGMQASIMSHPAAKKIVERIVAAEVTLLWEGEDAYHRRSRIDGILDCGGVLDLKTTRDASPRNFSRSCMDYGYYRQGAFYREGMMLDRSHMEEVHKELGVTPSGKHHVIAVENVEPYTVYVYEMSERALRYGEKEIDELLDIYAECKEWDLFPAYTQPEALELDLPPWVDFEKEDD